MYISISVFLKLFIYNTCNYGSNKFNYLLNCQFLLLHHACTFIVDWCNLFVYIIFYNYYNNINFLIIIIIIIIVVKIIF